MSALEIPLRMFVTGRDSGGLRAIINLDIAGQTVARDLVGWRKLGPDVFAGRLLIIDDPASDAWLDAYVGRQMAAFRG